MFFLIDSIGILCFVCGVLSVGVGVWVFIFEGFEGVSSYWLACDFEVFWMF